MLFPEQDAPTLKTWIVKRLETPARTDSDVDADVLADYVLALLRHDGEANDVRQLCETELYDFLKDEAKPFVDDVFQTVTYKSYIPGSRPPPKLPPPPPPAAAPTQIASKGSASLQGAIDGPVPGLPWSYQQQQFQYQPSNSRKRSYNESSIPEMGAASVPPGMPYYQQGGGRAFKQARRGGGTRGGRGGGYGGAGETMGHVPDADLAMGPMMLPPPPFGALGPGTTNSPTPGSMSLVPPNGASPYDPSAGLSMEALMQMHQMGMPVPMYGFPQGVVGPWNGNGNGNGNGDDGGRRRRRRCRYYEKKGFCTRPNCLFDHGEAQESEDAAADGHGGVFSMMPPPAVAAAMFQHMMPLPPQQRDEAPTEMPGAQGATRRARKGGRAPFSADGPVYDKSNSTVVVEGIPDENLNEAAVQEFFSQFGPIVSVSMQAKRKLAVVKFDEWAAANAAYHSPKVIFDNRFVKVFWHKERGSGGGGAGDETSGSGAKKNGSSAAGVEEGEVVEGEDGEMPEMDMEDFLRRQEEAQKRHEEREQLKQELERKRQELEQRQRSLQARQREERQRLIAKMAAVATRARQGSESGTPSESGGGGGGGGDGDSGSRAASSSSRSAAAISQTEMIRAQLAALEEEARQLGLDPDLIVGGDALSAPLPSWRGRGRGRGGRYSSYTPRGRGRGGYAARGGLHGSVSSSVALAYAAYSLDNRPRRIALTGADFTAPGHDEALRQYLLGVGDYVALDTTAETTTISFTDRRTAEKFYYGLALATDQSDKPTRRIVPGVADPVELAWVACSAVGSNGAGTTSGGLSGPLTSNNTLSGNGAAEKNGSWQPDEEGELDAAIDGGTANGDEDNADENLDEDVDGIDQQQDQEQEQEQKHSRHGFPQKQQQMDFDVADEGDWDIQ